MLVAQVHGLTTSRLIVLFATGLLIMSMVSGAESGSNPSSGNEVTSCSSSLNSCSDKSPEGKPCDDCDSSSSSESNSTSTTSPNNATAGSGTSNSESTTDGAEGSADTGDCPLSLPSVGDVVHLAMVSGAHDVGEPWQIDVGFGPARPLNYLSRLTRIGDEAKIFFPSHQGVVKFSQLDAGSDEYAMVPGELILPPDSTLLFSNVGTTAILTMADGRVWQYSLAPPPAGVTGWPTVYQLTEMTNRQGFSITLQ